MKRYYYLKFNYSQISEVGKLSLAESLVTIVRSIHQSNMVWVDCKLSNVVRFHSSLPEWRGIDFEHTLVVWRLVKRFFLLWLYTVLYAPPELVRWLYGSSSGGERLVSSKSMDMWSVFDGDCKWRGFV